MHDFPYSGWSTKLCYLGPILEHNFKLVTCLSYPIKRAFLLSTQMVTQNDIFKPYLSFGIPIFVIQMRITYISLFPSVASRVKMLKICKTLKLEFLNALSKLESQFCRSNTCFSRVRLSNAYIMFFHAYVMLM